jgi:hypothetical protein
MCLFTVDVDDAFFRARCACTVSSMWKVISSKSVIGLTAKATTLFCPWNDLK